MTRNMNCLSSENALNVLNQIRFVFHFNHPLQSQPVSLVCHHNFFQLLTIQTVQHALKTFQFWQAEQVPLLEKKNNDL